MRLLADHLDMRAPSLYKHFRNKEAIEIALIEIGLYEIGTAMHAALADPGPDGPILAVLRTYREQAVANPNMYRLSTHGPLPRADLADGLEDWAGMPFVMATGEWHLAQALFAFAHGMVILELDSRFPDGDLAPTWSAAAAAFAQAVGDIPR
jgi:AcrR family transcriptional regulator